MKPSHENTTAPREGEPFTQTLKRGRAKETSALARRAEQAEKDRTRRELEELARMRSIIRGYRRGIYTQDDAMAALLDLKE